MYSYSSALATDRTCERLHEPLSSLFFEEFSEDGPIGRHDLVAYSTVMKGRIFVRSRSQYPKTQGLLRGTIRVHNIQILTFVESRSNAVPRYPHSVTRFHPNAGGITQTLLTLPYSLPGACA